MQITVYSIIMTVLWSSMLIIAFSLLLKNHRLVDICSVTGVVLLYMFCVIRMFVPVEFPWVTIIPSDHIFNALHKFLYTNIELVGDGSVKIKYLLAYIWALVSVFLMLRLIFGYLHMSRKIGKLFNTKDKELDAVFAEFAGTEKKLLKVEVVKSSGIDVPFGFGILRKKILIPDKTYSRKDLFNIIRHEYTHFKNRDLPVQLLVNILCAIYWWNPFVYLLRKDIEHSFEMRCDQKVVHGMADDEIADYMETLLRVFQTKKSDKEDLRHVTGMLGVMRSSREDIRDRFDLLLQESSQSCRQYGRLVAVVAVVVILVLSYSFIIQPKILPTSSDIETDPGVYEVEMNESYILHYADDVYELITSQGDQIEIDGAMAEQMVKGGFQVKEAMEERE